MLFRSGADAIVIHSKSRDPKEIFEFVGKWGNYASLVIIPTTYYNLQVKEAEEKQIKMIIYANYGIRSSIRAMQNTFDEIYKKGSTKTVEGKITSLNEVFEIQGMHKMKESELKYSKTDSSDIVAVIPAAGDHLKEYSMKDIFKDIPISMLDINGKPLLQRQIETLNKCKIYSINAIVGYRKEAIDIGGVNLIHNPNYANTGILHSIMRSLNNINERVFICYGDVIFDHVILSRILETKEDITILVDSTFDSKHAETKKRRELVIAEGDITKSKRSLHTTSLKPIKKISSGLDPQKCQYEFPGIVLLSKKGVGIVKDIYNASLKQYRDKSFHSADKFENALFSDLLQEAIDKNVAVYGMEASSGWIEIHSLDDYKLACSSLR